MKNTGGKIHGKLTDQQGRCIHYNSPLDVIANKCSVCKKFYACYKCHDESEDHRFSAVSDDEKDTVMCGVCGRTFSYREYSALSFCPGCKSRFNPRCALHKNIYCGL
ncbi:CHY zinc finger protein [Treponema sp.]|uniref:CHY zinc finger protein n=1 Tax=Treponema sp. TaxID=166 RepID=UPI003F129553